MQFENCGAWCMKEDFENISNENKKRTLQQKILVRVKKSFFRNLSWLEDRVARLGKFSPNG
jgi:hypothetical protein